MSVGKFISVKCEWVLMNIALKASLAVNVVHIPV
jgi:hypothetical protein